MGVGYEMERCGAMEYGNDGRRGKQCMLGGRKSKLRRQ